MSARASPSPTKSMVVEKEQVAGQWKDSDESSSPLSQGQQEKVDNGNHAAPDPPSPTEPVVVEVDGQCKIESSPLKEQQDKIENRNHAAPAPPSPNKAVVVKVDGQCEIESSPPKGLQDKIQNINHVSAESILTSSSDSFVAAELSPNAVSTLQSEINMERKKYHCEVTGCGKSFYASQNLRHHISTIHSNIRHKCPTCPSSFSRSEHLKKHLDVHEQPTRHQCDICLNNFASKRNLVRHGAKCLMKKEREEGESSPKKQRTEYSDDSSGKLDTEEMSMNLDNLDGQITLEVAAKAEDKTEKMSGSSDHHELSPLSTISSSPVAYAQSDPSSLEYVDKDSVNISNQSYESGYGDELHEETVENSSPSQDDQSDSMCLKKPVKVHGGFKCDEENCGKVFKNYKDAEAHWNCKHQGIFYECAMCAKTYSHPAKLKTHEQIHANPSLHSCGKCKKNYSTLSTLNRHRKQCSSEFETEETIVTTP